MAGTDQPPEIVSPTGSRRPCCDVTRWRPFPVCSVSPMNLWPVTFLVVGTLGYLSISHLLMTSSQSGELLKYWFTRRKSHMQCHCQCQSYMGRHKMRDIKTQENICQSYGAVRLSHCRTIYDDYYTIVYIL